MSVESFRCSRGRSILVPILFCHPLRKMDKKSMPTSDKFSADYPKKMKSTQFKSSPPSISTWVNIHFPVVTPHHSLFTAASKKSQWLMTTKDRSNGYRNQQVSQGILPDLSVVPLVNPPKFTVMDCVETKSPSCQPPFFMKLHMFMIKLEKC